MSLMSTVLRMRCLQSSTINFKKDGKVSKTALKTPSMTKALRSLKGKECIKCGCEGVTEINLAYFFIF